MRMQAERLLVAALRVAALRVAVPEAQAPARVAVALPQRQLCLRQGLLAPRVRVLQLTAAVLLRAEPQRLEEPQLSAAALPERWLQ